MVITKEMEEEEKQLMKEGESKEQEMMEKVSCSIIPFIKSPGVRYKFSLFYV